MEAFRRRIATVVVLISFACSGAASAQIDLSGNWQPAQAFVRLIAHGPGPGDFMGIPLNADGRAMAKTADFANTLEELNRQCQLWMVSYLVDGPFGLQIRPIGDPHDLNHVVAWYINGTTDRAPMTIWVDGHEPPSPLSLHTWAGFATGQWRGDTLAVSITHLKDGWLARNGAPMSNQATATMFLSRTGDTLTETLIVHDPEYLSAPYPQAATFRLSEVSPTFVIGTENDCLPDEIISGLSDGDHAASYLPWQRDNPSLAFMMQNYGIRPQVALGGEQEMYPEFRKVLRKEYEIPPGYCSIDGGCCSVAGPMGDQCPAPSRAAAPGASADRKPPRSR